MSSLPSFDNGVTAMMAHTIAFDAISQNIANVRTPGYRRSEATFATLLGGIEAAPHRGGGVRPEIRTLIDVQGSIESSTRPLDLAINGKGFFIYSSEPAGTGEIVFSRQASLFGANVDDDEAVGSYLSTFDDKYLMAWELDPDGSLSDTSLASMVGIPASYNDPFPGRATTSASLTAILPADGTAEAVTEIGYFDSTGSSGTLTLRWTNTAINTWDLNFYDASGSLAAGPETMTFDGEGNLTSTATLSPASLFSIDVSGVTQRGTFFHRGPYTQDGIGEGAFIDYEIDDRGKVFGRFTSGAVSPLYQLALASFANPNGLIDVGNNQWVAGEESGDPEFVSAGDLAVILSGASEASNVDLADAFSQLIVTQRAYSSAAQLIRTADEMTETARDLKS